MESLREDDRPQICWSVGLECGRCAAEAARKLAEICAGLTQDGLGRVFFQMFPDAACAPMHGHFVRSYKGEPELSVCRIPAARAKSAVA